MELLKVPVISRIHYIKGENRMNLQLLTIDEVSKLLVEKPSTIRTWIRRKKFPDICIVKLGGSVRFREKHLEDWLNNGCI
jgi:excisionase family DNA binding protein